MTYHVQFRYQGDPVVLVIGFDSIVDAWRFAAQQRRTGWAVKIGPRR